MPTPTNIVIGQQIDESKIRRAKELRRDMTPVERALWARLRANRLEGFHFRRQQVIDGFIVDFYCHAAALVVEVDGPIHEEQVEYDAERGRIIAARGIEILRVTNDDIRFKMNEVLINIARVCKERSGR